MLKINVIAIDPLISALGRMAEKRDGERSPPVTIVSAFVDDWAVGCVGTDTIREVSEIVARFERSSGQQIKKKRD